LESPGRNQGNRIFQEQELLLRVSRVLASTLDLEAVLQAIADGAAELLDVESSAIYLLEPDGHLYLGATLPPLDPGMPEALRWAEVADHPHIGRSASSGEIVVLRDAVDADLSPAERRVVDLRSLRSIIYLPFKHEGRVVGVLILGTTSRSREFSDHDLDLCRTLTNQLALGVQNARLHAGLKEHAARLEAEIEERARAEKALRSSQERFRALFEQAGDYILLLEAHGEGSLTIVDANQAACETHGYRLEELLGLSVLELDRSLTPEEGADILRKIRAGEQVRFETVHARKDGTEFPVEVSAKALDLGDGRTYLLSIERDISQRRRWERELLRQQRTIKLNHSLARTFLTAEPEEAYPRVLERVMDAVVCDLGLFGTINAEGDLVFTFMVRNKAGKPEILGNEQSFSPDTWAGMWGQSLRERRTLLSGVGFQLPEGHPHLETVLLSPIVHSDTLIGLLGVANKEGGFGDDDQALIESVADHVAPVLRAHQERARQERERERVEEQLRHAQKMDAVGQLAGGVAHDFNNLLHLIQGHTDLALLDVPPGSPVNEALENVKEASERAATLVQRLLTFSRQQVPDLKALDLKELVSDLTRMVRRVIGEHINLEVKYGPGSTVIEADAGHMEQILLNLCVNARDAMPDGGSIHITTERTELDEVAVQTLGLDRSGPFVRLSVSDTGSGMDPETLERAFDPFFTTKEPGKGTGLGLSTAYGLIKQHSGAVHVRSDPGEGTTFDLYFPFRPGLAAAGEKRTHSKPPGGTETILLAEDDDGVRSLSEFILTSAGYTVHTARDGREAVDAFQRLGDGIDLVLLDVVMPGLGGKAVRDRVVEMGFRGPILFASGYAADVLENGCPEDDFPHFLQKPFTRNEILHRVRGALDGMDGSRQKEWARPGEPT
jgi:PAS domain S-box-containing protein